MHHYLMIDLEGYEITSEERELLQHPKIGGVILFSRNFADPNQLKALTKQIRSINNEFLIAVDQEGGRVQRFRNGFTAIPPAGDFGKLFDKNPEQAKVELTKYAKLVAAELNAVGVNVNFAPVLDLNVGLGKVIGDRSYHQNPTVVAELATIYINVLREAKILCVAKHFPGHGGVIEDTHLEKAIDLRDYAEIFANDLLPFRSAIAAGIDGMMASHVVYEKIDPNPATFSTVWLKNILREKLKFKGIIFSDDLNMQAAGEVGDFDVRVKLALNAGCDLALICNNRQGVKTALSN